MVMQQVVNIIFRLLKSQVFTGVGMKKRPNSAYCLFKRNLRLMAVDTEQTTARFYSHIWKRLL